MSTKTKDIYFFDDDEGRGESVWVWVEGVRKRERKTWNKPTTEEQRTANKAGYNIIFIKVAQTDEGEVAEKYSGENERLSHRGYGHDREGALVKEPIHPGGGIGDKEIIEINKAIESDAAALVFDWDQTLSLIEGLAHPDPDKFTNLIELHSWYRDELKTIGPKFTAKELAKYFLHDPKNPKRIENLKKALQAAEKNNIPIFVLTNNKFALPVAEGGRPQLLVDILHEALEINVPLTHIVKGGREGPLSKGKTIVDKIIPIIKSGGGYYGPTTLGLELDEKHFTGGKTKKRKSRKSKKVKKRKLRKTKKKHSAVTMNNKNTKKRNTKKRSPQYVKGIDNSELRKYGLGPNKWYYKN